MNGDVVLSVKNVSKCFEMYEKPVHRLYQTLCAGKKKFYKEFWALKDISFEVRKGECVGIIGRNGAGKSTLLQIITGTLAPTTGSVELKGRVAALLELGSGFNPEFTGRENVYLNGAILGLSKEEIDARYQDILDFADIGEFIDQPVKTYSSGMMVRLAFAVIAHVDADILIVDEALSVGDAFFQQKCMRFMRKFIEEHTVLFVSHDTAAINNFCRRGILLDHGAVELEGEAKAVTQRYLKDLYGESQDVDGGNEETVGLDSGSVGLEVDSDYRDMRADLINASNLRNDIEVFRFDEHGESFGDRKASVVSVHLCDSQEIPLSCIVGGEMVKLVIVGEAHAEISSPIVGFFVRDRLGQNLWGDNTCLIEKTKSMVIPPGARYRTVFEFRMPYLSPGDYAICVSLAEGCQNDHVQHQWMNDALIFRSSVPLVSMGIIGLPTRSINMELL